MPGEKVLQINHSLYSHVAVRLKMSHQNISQDKSVTEGTIYDESAIKHSCKGKDDSAAGCTT